LVHPAIERKVINITLKSHAQDLIKLFIENPIT
jgi:hypothetical protein